MFFPDDGVRVAALFFENVEHWVAAEPYARMLSRGTVPTV
jgi:hypothetical protein